MVAAVPLPLGCSSDGSDRDAPVVPRDAALGAVFDVDATRALIWVGGAPGATATVIATDASGAPVTTAVLPLGDAGTAFTELVGLRPGTAYAAAITVDDDAVAGPYRFVTAPADSDRRPVRLAWSADFDLDPQFASSMLDTTIAVQPEHLITLGDFPYTDNAPGAITLDEYRDRHRAARGDAAMQRLLRALPVRSIYDDHEVRNDWDLGTSITEPDRVDAALRAWDEYFPVRTDDPAVRFRRWRWGANVECFLLDCRRYRACSTDADTADKSMLGAAQRAWLLDAVAASSAVFKLIFTSVPLDYGASTEHWNVYTAERGLIFDELVQRRVRGVLFLSGDQHWFASHRHDHNIRELQSGPLARGFHTPPLAVPGVLVRIEQTFNVGVLDIDAETIRARCVDAAGAIRYEELLTRDELTPR